MPTSKSSSKSRSSAGAIQRKSYSSYRSPNVSSSLSDNQMSRVNTLKKNRETSKSKADEQVVIEIVNYTFNDYDSYQKASINIDSLIRKRKNGSYTEDGVLLASQNIGVATVRNYRKDFGSFPVNKWDRTEIAFEIKERIESDVSDSIIYEYDVYIPEDKELYQEFMKARSESNDLIMHKESDGSFSSTNYNRDNLREIWTPVVDKTIAYENKKKNKHLVLTSEERIRLANIFIRDNAEAFDPQLRFLHQKEAREMNT